MSPKAESRYSEVTRST